MKKRRFYAPCVLCALLLGLWMSVPLKAQDTGIQLKRGILENIFISKSSSGLEVRIVLSSYESFNEYEVQDPLRLVLDLAGVREFKAMPEIEVRDAGILRIRTGLFSENFARVVFDVEGQIPKHEISRVPDGLKIIFLKQDMSASGIKTEEQGVVDKAEAQTDIEKAGEGGENKDIARKAEPKELTLEERLKETQKKLEETIKILNELRAEQLARKNKFIRVMAIGDQFLPHEGILKNVYGRGFNYGAEISFGVGDFIEVWLAEHYFGKSVKDEATGEDRKVSLIPFEAGFKVRLNKGSFNPYLGIGGGYFQYKETSPAGTIREKQFGVVGQAGFFVKIGGFFVADFYAQYKYCPIQTGEKFDVGGFHIGGGIGAEF